MVADMLTMLDDGGEQFNRKGHLVRHLQTSLPWTPELNSTSPRTSDSLLPLIFHGAMYMMIVLFYALISFESDQ